MQQHQKNYGKFTSINYTCGTYHHEYKLDKFERIIEKMKKLKPRNIDQAIQEKLKIAISLIGKEEDRTDTLFELLPIQQNLAVPSQQNPTTYDQFYSNQLV